MKKLIAVFLILAIILQMPALAEDQDPIIGNWYVYIKVPGSPLEASLQDYTQMIVILTFLESGQIVYSEMDFKGAIVEMSQPGVWGKWEKNESDYSVSIVAVGTEKAFFEDGLLYVAAFSTDLYFGFRKLEQLDFYLNIYRK